MPIAAAAMPSRSAIAGHVISFAAWPKRSAVHIATSVAIAASPLVRIARPPRRPTARPSASAAAVIDIAGTLGAIANSGTVAATAPSAKRQVGLPYASAAPAAMPSDAAGERRERRDRVQRDAEDRGDADHAGGRAVERGMIAEADVHLYQRPRSSPIQIADAIARTVVANQISLVG